MALPSVFLFNTSSNLIYVYLNGAGPVQALSAGGTSPAANWVPQSPMTQPTFTETPTAGTVGWGGNQVQVSGWSGLGTPFTINVPRSSQPIFSIEIYLFYQNVNNVSWIVLADGAFLSGSVSNG
jgi:hypothetical protein